MKNYNQIIAHQLIQCKAITLNPDNPYTWASGWKSPIYCDNRKTLSYPTIRNAIKFSFVEIIKEKFFSTEAIAGVATGAIAHGVLVADLMHLPFVYVRSEPKGHGLENQVEGYLNPGQKVVVIEDLISTGSSSIRAVEALRKQGAEVLGMVAIFTYGFALARENFRKAACTLYTLSDYDALLQVAAEKSFISSGQLQILRTWRQSPETWMQ